MVCVCSLVELRLAKAARNGARLAVWEGMPVSSVALSVATGSSYAAFMTAFWLSGDPVARFRLRVGKNQEGRPQGGKQAAHGADLLDNSFGRGRVAQHSRDK